MSPSSATFTHFMPSHLFVLRSIITLPSYPCEIHNVFFMVLPTPLTEWLSNTSTCTSLEWGNHKTATKVVLLVCSNYHITCNTQVCMLVCFYSNYYLFAIFYSLTTQISITYLTIKIFISGHENICLQFCLPVSYRVVSMLSNKPGLGSVCVCVCARTCVCRCYE